MSIIRPGSKIGVLGGGQLGRMFAMAARRLGYRVHTLAPEEDTPTGQVADVEVNASYDDLDAVARFADAVDVVTFEFENVSAAAATAAASHAIVRPNGRALWIAQHRIREKTFVSDVGLPVTPFAPVRTAAELDAAIDAIGVPSVLKTAEFGYDGKGQIAVMDRSEAGTAWSKLGRRESILEAFIDLEKEISVVAARSVDGTCAAFEPVENVHRHHILDLSTAPADVTADMAAQAVDAAYGIMRALDYVGVLCVEFFVARDGRLLVNEMAPRPHNSGHHTVDSCRASQFEQQVRAVCGLPLGSPQLLQPAAMANLLGDLWQGGEPNWVGAMSFPEVKLHLYGKTSPRVGRKMGHLTVLAATKAEAERRVLQAREALIRR